MKSITSNKALNILSKEPLSRKFSEYLGFYSFAPENDYPPTNKGHVRPLKSENGPDWNGIWKWREFANRLTSQKAPRQSKD